jgi:hypothetical protein
MGIAEFLDPGDILGFQQDSKIAAANKALQQVQAKSDETSNANRALYNQYMNRVQNTYGDTAGKYNQYLQNLENQEVYNPGEFSFDKNVEDYYSKFANQRANQAMNAITNSRANAGDMFSSDYQNALAAKQQALASEEADKAYDRYMQERGQALNEFSTNANLQNQAYQNAYNKNKDLLGQAQNAQDNVTNAYGSYISNLAGQNNTDMQNYANVMQQMAANQASKKGLLGRIFG